MAKALHPFIHDGKQYYTGDEVLATGEELIKLQLLGSVEETIKLKEKAENAESEKAEPEKEAKEVIDKVKKIKKR